MKLYTKILLGMVIGTVVGLALNFTGFGEFSGYLKPIGDVFIRLIKMVVVPLVLVSLILGAASLGDIRKLGRMGVKTVFLFFGTTAIAVTIGLVIANVAQPGMGLSEEKKNELIEQYQEKAAEKTSSENAEMLKSKSEGEKIKDMIVNMVPTNPIQALASGDMLAIIFFALFLGICITLIPPDKSAPLIKAFDAFNDAIIMMVTLIMELAPYGVAALMIDVVATLGFEILVSIIIYSLCVMLGLFLVALLIYLPLLKFYVKQSPLMFLKGVKEALLFSFGTSSSSATLPISMNVAETNLGISREVSSFVLPLGATINMNGTALYQAIAAIFIAQVFSIDLTMGQQLTIILTATLAAVGAAGVPGAGMVTLAVVLTTVNIPEVGIAIIFGLDRLLDMLRTVVNVTGDLTVTAVVAKSEGEEFTFTTGKDLIEG